MTDIGGVNVEYDYEERRRAQNNGKIHSFTQTIIGSLLILALPAMGIYAITSRDSLRDLGNGFDGLAAWQEQHEHGHTDSDALHFEFDKDTSTLKYRVTDCRESLRDLENRVHNCEIAVGWIKASSGMNMSRMSK